MSTTRHSLLTIIVALVLLGSYQFISAQQTWTPAPPNPPSNNSWMPINTSATSQDKIGGLTLGGGLLTGGNFVKIDGNMPNLILDDTDSGMRTMRIRSNDNRMRFIVDTTPSATVLMSLDASGSAGSEFAWFPNQVSAGSFVYNSDISLKKNVVTAPGLDVVTKLRGVQFDWKKNDERDFGFIAQEVEKVAPELVGSIDGVKNVAYGNISAFLVEAIKEQQKQIEALEEKIAVSCESQ